MATGSEQTIWIPPRTTLFTEVCEACEDEQPEGLPWATVRGSLPLDETTGSATCDRGHTMRVVRMGVGMPAGALR